MAALILLRYRGQRRLLRRNRIFRDRTNPLHKFNDLELFWQFRFRRADILHWNDKRTERGARTFESEGRATSRFHRPENSAESLPTMNINSSSNGLSWTAPVLHFFNFVVVSSCCFFFVFRFCCCCLYIYIILGVVVVVFLFFSLFSLSLSFFFSLSLSLWRSLSSCHSAFHELGLVFERTHRSCFLFLRYPATTGPFVGWSPRCLRCSEWSLYSQPLLREAQWSLREYNWVSWPVLSSHLHSARPLFFSF